jgi:xylulokinase
LDVILAIDVGTSGAEVSLLDRTGKLKASAYNAYVLHGEGSYVEQNPKDWWQAVACGIRSLPIENSDTAIAGIALSGQMKDVILLEAGETLGNAILYMDSRAQDENRRVHACLEIKRLQQVTSNLQDASSLLAKLLWFKEKRSSLYQQADMLLVGAHDYIAYRLCGARRADYTTASTTGLLDAVENAWAVDLLECLELRTDWLPRLTVAGELIGEVSHQAAEDTGLVVGTPVFQGAGDVASTTLGAGAGAIGRSYVYLGTSGWYAMTSENSVDPDTGISNLRHPEPERWISVGHLLAAGSNFDWLCQEFGHLELEAIGELDGLPQAMINKMARSAAPGCGGLVYFPHPAGLRSPVRDPQARGVFFGVTLTTTRQDLYRAVLEGVAYAMRSIRDLMGGNSTANRLNIVGGGAKSAVWAQIFADVFACKVNMLADPMNVGTRGAALSVGRTLGWYSSYQPSSNFFPVAEAFEPQSEAVECYESLYAVFQGLYPAFRSGFAALNGDRISD